MWAILKVSTPTVSFTWQGKEEKTGPFTGSKKCYVKLLYSNMELYSQQKKWTYTLASNLENTYMINWIRGFPGGSDGKAFACNVEDPGLIPGPGRSPGEGNGNPLQSMDGGAWWATQSMELQRVGHHWATSNWIKSLQWLLMALLCLILSSEMIC